MAVKTNPVTGKPEQADKVIDEQIRNEQKMLEGMEVSEALKSDEGSVFVKSIRNRLEKRIAVLIKGDQECQAYRNILGDIGNKLLLAEWATNEILKKDLREG